MSVTLRLYNGAGDFVTTLPLVGDVAVMDTLNEEGSGQLSYFAAGKGADTLMSMVDGSIGVHLDGQEVFEFLVDDDEDDEASDAGMARQIKIGGPGTLALLARGIVLPEDGIGAIPAIHPFKDATPGAIMLRLLTKMKERGYLTQITPSFTATTDSAGNAWDVYVDIEYDAGKDLLTVVKDLAAQGACDVRMVGRRLDLFRPNKSLGVDRPGIYIRRAHAESAPRKRSKRNLRTDFLVVGDEGINLLRFDAAARAKYGRRIGYVGQGNTTTTGTLTRIGDESLQQNARPSRGYTISLRSDHPTCPKPYVDFFLGDRIRTDYAPAEDALGYEPMRVRSMSTTFGSDGVTKVSVELNDRFLEAILDLAKRVDGIRHGKVSTSSAPPSTTPGTDLTVPSPPRTLSIRPKLAYSPEGMKSGTLEVSWPAAEVNDDGTPMNDLDHYEVRYKLLDQQIDVVEPPPVEEPTDPVDPELIVTREHDEFDRPDSPNIGNGWTQTFGDFDLVAGEARSSTRLAALLRSVPAGDVLVETQFQGTAGQPGAVARTTLSSGLYGGYYAYVDLSTVSGNNVFLRKNGAQVAAGRFGPAGQALGAGWVVLRITVFERRSGEAGRERDVVRVDVNGVPSITWTETGTAPTGTYGGAVNGGDDELTRYNFVTVQSTSLPQPDPVEGAPETPETPDVPLEDAYTLAGQTSTTSILLVGLPIRQRIIIEVRAVDKTGNPSEWLVSDELWTPLGDEEPTEPTAPRLTAKLGGVLVEWDRKNADGGDPAPDMAEVEVHAGPTASFQVGPTTQVGSMIGGTAFIAGLEIGIPVWIRLRARDYTGNYSDLSAAAQITPQPITADLNPNVQISGAQLTPGTVGTAQLVVGVLSDGMLLNGGFEETTDSGLPVGWVASADSRFAGSTIDISSTLPKDGVRCLRLNVAAGREAEAVCLPYYPLGGLGQYYVAAQFKGTIGQAQVGIYWYDGQRALLAYTGAIPINLSGAWTLSEQVLQAPANAVYGRVAVTARASAGGTQVFVDSVDLRKATGRAQILNASISTAQIEQAAIQRALIADLAVGDAQIGNVRVDKLLAGTLSAQYVVVTGRLTSKSDGTQIGARWELDSNSFRAYKPTGEQTVRIGADGTAYFAGELGTGVSITSPVVTGGTITGSVFQTKSSGERVAIGEFGSGNRIFFHGTGTEPAYIQVKDDLDTPFNITRAVQMQLRVPGGGSWPASYIRMDGRGIRIDYGEQTHTNNTDIVLDGTGVRISGSGPLGGRLFSQQEIRGFGIYDTNERVYSPWNQPPGTGHSHTQYSPTTHSHPREEQAEYLSSRATSPVGTYTLLFSNGQTQIRRGGSVMAVFNASATAKTFVIDHPKDPDRFLRHAVIEGPTADVFYRGEGQLAPDLAADPADWAARVPRAVIALPGYFEDLTLLEGRTVTVTPIAGPCDQPGCDAFLPPSLACGAVRDGRFTVYATAGFTHEHARFYWEVKAVRKDAGLFDVEPRRDEHVLHGDGPYTYLTPR